MMRSALNVLFGWREISVPKAHAVRALNLIREHQYAHWRLRHAADGSLSFRMRLKDSAQYLVELNEATGGRVHGLPALLARYRGRWGIPVGALLFAILVWQSCTVVWDVKISGNEKLSEKEIVTMLEEFGFGVGARFGGIDFDEMQNAFLLTTDEIAWIAVNMEGTVAHVQVRENLGGRDSAQSAPPANVVAAEDGQVLEVRLVGGRTAVSRGDIVRKGELLISGILTIREDGLRYEYGAGEVLAQVNRVIDVSSPLVREKSVLTGRETERKSVRFFAKNVKLFRNYGIDYATYDTIILEKQLTLPGGLTLPVRITTETVRETAVETVTVSEEEAFADAALLYRAELDALLAECEILEIETECTVENGVCRIVGRAVCIANIARTAEIPVRSTE